MRILFGASLAVSAIVLIAGCGGKSVTLPEYSLSATNLSGDFPEIKRVETGHMLALSSVGGVRTWQYSTNGTSWTSLPSVGDPARTEIADIETDGTTTGFTQDAGVYVPVGGSGASVAILTSFAPTENVYNWARRGTLVGGIRSVGANAQAFRRDGANAPVTITNATNYQPSSVMAILPDGTMIGNGFENTTEKFYTVSGTTMTIGGTGFIADVSENGIAVGYADKPFRLLGITSGKQELPLPFGSTNGRALGVNSNGDIVGSYRPQGELFDRGCVWYAETGAFVDLQEAFGNLLASGLLIFSARQVDDSGKIYIQIGQPGAPSSFSTAILAPLG